MTQGPGAVKRLCLTLLLGVQLLGISVPFADARLESAPASAVHIEERTDRSCDPVHLHDECVLCQHLATHGAFAAAASCALLPPAVGAAFVPTPRSDPATPPAFLERGRSPPSI